MALASRRCLTTLTSHGASLLSHLQRLKPPTASRSLCDSSLIERDSAIPTQYRPRFDLTMEMEKVGKQPYHALKGDIIYTERLNHSKVKDKVYFVKVALLSLDKHRCMMHLKTGQLLTDAYVETAFEGHVQQFGKVST
ncbi:hypothetical protein FH972_020589 [Carpinus fangiana]|uniref:Uncharacterized protein n=1 Tax=Carpinus fangiana TaxID=176857 RepID=A0A5N6RTS3_9ROSI|nr:hypothetical protein FH972_020589 [Carpinus fangiana]